MESYTCICGCSEGKNCEMLARVISHAEDTGILLEPSASLTSITVRDYSRFTCHPRLLSHFSALNAPSYIFEREDHAVIHKFVSWIYTGRLNYKKSVPEAASPERLWVWGVKINSPQFANEAMHLLLAKLSETKVSAATAEYVYKNTKAGSKLRLCIVDSIAATGPLRFSTEDQETRDRLMFEWKDLLRRGGDLVIDTMAQGKGFAALDMSRCPWLKENRDKYLLDDTTPHLQPEDEEEVEEEQDSLFH